MERSEGGAVARLPQGDDIEIYLLGQKTRRKWLISTLLCRASKADNSSFLICASRKRRSPSPGRRRRSPSPPRRRRSPSPRRRYQYFYQAVRNCYENGFKSEWFLIPGLRLHHLVVVLCHRGDILPLSSVATAPPLCHHRRGGCPFHLSDAPLPWPSDGPLGPPSAGVLLHREDAHLHPLSLHPDTGEAQWLSEEAGTPDPQVLLPAACLLPLLTAVTLWDVPPVLKDVLSPLVPLRSTKGENLLRIAANPSAECRAPQSHASTRGNFSGSNFNTTAF